MKKKSPAKSTEATEKKPLKSGEFLSAAATVTAAARKSIKVRTLDSGKKVTVIEPSAEDALRFILTCGPMVAEMIEAARIARDAAKAEGSKAFTGTASIVCEKVKGIKLDDAAVIKLGTAAMKRAMNLGDFKSLIAERLAK
jgi:NifU-like protein involved in Fe-S cluster formation